MPGKSAFTGFNLPYVIVYTVRDEDAVILRVRHERQDCP
jgi:plasmid stabilization system protein ParE